MLNGVVVYDRNNVTMVDVAFNEAYGDRADERHEAGTEEAGPEWVCITGEFGIDEIIGLKDTRNNRDVYEHDIYFEEDAQDHGDRRIFFVVTWINERCSFSMLEVSEYQSYISNGFDAIERDFDGFYFEVMQGSIDKMHYAGNIYENPNLLQ